MTKEEILKEILEDWEDLSKSETDESLNQDRGRWIQEGRDIFGEDDAHDEIEVDLHTIVIQLEQIRKETGDELFNLILPTINRLTVGGEKDVQYALNRQTDAQNDLSYTEDLKRLQNTIQSKVTTGLSIEGEIAEIELFFELSGAKPSPLKYLIATCFEIFVPKRSFDFSKSRYIFVCFGN